MYMTTLYLFEKKQQQQKTEDAILNEQTKIHDFLSLEPSLLTKISSHFPFRITMYWH